MWLASEDSLELWVYYKVPQIHHLMNCFDAAPFRCLFRAATNASTAIAVWTLTEVYAKYICTHVRMYVCMCVGGRIADINNKNNVQQQQQE